MVTPSVTTVSGGQPERGAGAAPAKIVSGGQSGVDRAALDVAIKLGILCGGWVPKGRRAEDGPLDSAYPMIETQSSGYEDRTRRNVVDSDATLLITRGAPDGGTKVTVDEAAALGKPYHIVDLMRTHSPLAALRWLESKRPNVLNIAGPRESTAPGIYDEASTFLTHLMNLAAGSRGA